jgi:16S rRNA (cytosine1402-N4)-methyltransferase
MAAEVCELLITDRQGAYLDLTAGGGGHLRVLARTLEAAARLYGIDRDPEAVARLIDNTADIVPLKSVTARSFAQVREAAAKFEDRQFDGILYDLGLSTDQLDEPGRGFAFSSDGPLDMRFDTGTGESAADLLNRLSETELIQLLREFGEERQATRIASAIVRERRRNMIRTTSQLAAIVTDTIRPPHQVKSLARVFQALRIAVNDELRQLQESLPASRDLLKTGGRLAVISYHSLEDRIVKQFIRSESTGVCTCPPGLPQCICGATPRLKSITRKPVVPGAAEQAQNPRSRSAKLRVAERV